MSLPVKRAPPIGESPVAARAQEADLRDLRFRSLIADEDWTGLPPAIRRRFTKRLHPGTSAVYVGTVVETRMSRLGWAVAQMARIVGGPLPTSRATGYASVVSVTEDAAGGGQVWTRLYARPNGFPQTINSAKRFAGPTGLEEQVGGGLGMSLDVAVVDGRLVFTSRRYFLRLGGWRLPLPGFLTPGSLTVTHGETGANRFAFILTIRHPWFGTLIRQEAEFRDVVDA
ncbi:DUF4166 domain-containing protein [Methylobacterium sp. E-045]|uniref:DUF4166 domain-containing protein n=1 Tax=Methylobacterium sp. E-045 TaxID=2836575 RepID=UPI001FBAE37B|nr:DUF4166 domain-containing protein [Methylobacterium sp. E-045]MCJ2132102.1 DUF4166 domain-containing protein [Methylobacterium sp. E-045]